MPEVRPAVEGWFTLDRESPALVGLECGACSTVVFPPRRVRCPNPACGSDQLGRRELSRRGRVWSYATNHYQPPEPYMSPDPFAPYTVVAVELPDERLIVLGQLAGDAGDIAVGDGVELALDTLFVDDDGTEHVVWKWRPEVGG